MRQYYLYAAAAVVLGTAANAWSVTPQQAGNYTGSLTLKVYKPSGTEKQKHLMFLSLGTETNGNDITTVTLNGVPQTGGPGSSTYGVTEGMFLWADPSVEAGTSAYLATAHLKNSTITGKVTGTVISGTHPNYTLRENVEGKFKVKKLP